MTPMQSIAGAVGRWVVAFREATEADPELRAHGRHYTCVFQLDMESHRILVRMRRARVDALAVDPPALEADYQFGLRASAETWRRMAVPLPEPMYHGIFAANAKRDLRFEGDLLVMMQNLRCFVRHVELLRLTGVPL
jgi:hypothetical protein